MSVILKIGLPSGSLQDSTFALFKSAGYSISLARRSYLPSINDPQLEAVMFRAQEMSRYVEDGVVDLGLTGKDWIEENESDVVEVSELVYSKQSAKPSRWVLAVPNESPVQTVRDLAGGIVATELVQTTRRWFEQQQVSVKVEFSWGSTEVKARLLDAIVDITETGSSLQANNLRIVDTLMTSTTRMIANKQAWQDPAKRDKIEMIALHLQGALAARNRVGLKLNVSKNNLPKVLALLPAMRRPTISHLVDDDSQEDWVAVEVILEQQVERELVPALRRAGAEGLVVYPLSKVIP